MSKKNLIITALIIALPGGFLIWLAWRYFFRDGIGDTGKFDDEGGNTEINTMAQFGVTAAQQPVQLKYFKISEFDSPDLPGSGGNMRISTLLMLDDARGRAGVPFSINSGFRTKAHNASLREVGSVNASAHTEGYAADIDFAYNDIETAKKIAKACKEAGFQRFGVYNTPTASFIHVDNDPRKKPAVWTSVGAKLPFNPNFL